MIIKIEITNNTNFVLRKKDSFFTMLDGVSQMNFLLKRRQKAL